jgi:hypothetical protein
MLQVDEILSILVAAKARPELLAPIELAGWSDCGRLAALELPALWSAVVLLVCELVLGMPVLAPVLVAPVWAVVVPEAVVLPVPVVEAEVLGVEVVLDGVLGVVVVVAPVLDWVWTLPLGVDVVVVVGWFVVTVVDGVLAEVVPLVAPGWLPAVVAGPEVLAPGAVELVLPVVEAVPVWAAVPDAVVLLPGIVLLAEVLGVELVLP